MRFKGFPSGNFDTTIISTMHMANIAPMKMRRSRIISMSVSSDQTIYCLRRRQRHTRHDRASMQWDDDFADWPKRQSSKLKMGPRKRYADDCNGEEERCCYVRKGGPPASDYKPDDIAQQAQ